MINKNKHYILICIIAIMIISLLNMINARLINEIYNYHLIKQFIWYIIGFMIIFVVSKINVNKLFDYSFLFYIVSIILLILVLFIGTEVNGAKAWFNFYGISFQPSELTKLTLTLYLTTITTKFNRMPTNTLIYILKITLLTLIPSILVFIEPDTGAIIFYLIIYLATLFTSKIRVVFKLILVSIILLISSFFIYIYLFNQELLIDLIGTSFFYRIDRLINFSDNYQIINSLTLIGSSSLFGSGLNELSLYVPEAPTDFIFAFNIGNFGLISGIFITIIFFLLDYLLIKNANKNLFANIFIILLIFGQVYNILMNIGLLPIMGIPIPFLSYGGSTLIIYFLFLSIYLKLI